MIAALCMALLAGACFAGACAHSGRMRIIWIGGAFWSLIFAGHFYLAGVTDRRLAEEAAVCVGRGDVRIVEIARNAPRRVTCGDGGTYPLAD